MTGTVRDNTVYANITLLLNEKGVRHSQKQITKKLKALKKQNVKVHDHYKNRSGVGCMDWPCYNPCNSFFGDSALANPVQLHLTWAVTQVLSELP